MTTTEYIDDVMMFVDGFLGTHPCNMIPKLDKKNRFNSMIINLDVSWKPGSHWVGIFVENSTNAVHYYDPLGLKMRNKYITEFVNKFDNVHYNKQRVQPTESVHCGVYCIGFVLHSVKNGVSIPGFNKMFCKTELSSLFNDDIVVRYIINNR